MKHALSHILKEEWCPIQGLLCCFETTFPLHVFLAMANVSLWASKLSNPESGSPKNHCIGSDIVDEGVNLDPFHTPKRMASLL